MMETMLFSSAVVAIMIAQAIHVSHKLDNK